jgi:hypothetical protein
VSDSLLEDTKFLVETGHSDSQPFYAALGKLISTACSFSILLITPAIEAYPLMRLKPCSQCRHTAAIHLFIQNILKTFFLPIMHYFSQEEKDAMLKKGLEFDQHFIHQKYPDVVKYVASRYEP